MSTSTIDFEVTPEKKPPQSEGLASQPTNMMEAIQARIITGDLPVETLVKMLDFQRELKKDQAKEAFVAAMNAFKRNPPVVLKNAVANIRSKKGDNSSFKYNYAPLDTVCRAVVGALSERGLSHRWLIDDSQADVIKVTCILTHELGHSEETSMRGPIQASDFINALQSRAVTVSYLERYTLMAATGLAATIAADDDGAAPGEKSGLTDERFVQLDDGIKGAGNDDELKRLYQIACKEADAAGDESAKRDFNKSKNQRYRELHIANR